MHESDVPVSLAGRGVGGASETALGRRIAFYSALLAVNTLVGLALVRLPLLLVVGTVIALASAGIILARPYIGLLLYTVFFILRPGEIWPILGALHLERIVAALTLAALFAAQLQEERQLFLDKSRQTHLLLFFVLAVALSVPLAYWRKAAVDGLVEVLKIVGYYIMVVHLVNTRARLRYFVWTFCLLIAFVSAQALYSYVLGGSFYTQGIDRAIGNTSFSNNANELGTTLASAVPVFVLLAFRAGRRVTRLILGLFIPLILSVIVLTGSRASMLGLLTGLLFLWWRSKHRLVVGIVGFCLVVASFSLMPEQYKTRYSTITKSELDGSSKSRIVAWGAGLQMLLDRPLFGVGIGCYGTAHALRYSPEGTQDWLAAHSLYLQVLGELGLVGTFAFFSFLLEVLRLNRSTARGLASLSGDWSFSKAILDATFAGVAVLLVSGVFGHSLLRRTWYLFAAMDLAILRMSWHHLEGLSNPKRLPEPGPLHRMPL